MVAAECARGDRLRCVIWFHEPDRALFPLYVDKDWCASVTTKSRSLGIRCNTKFAWKTCWGWRLCIASHHFQREVTGSLSCLRLQHRQYGQRLLNVLNAMWCNAYSQPKNEGANLSSLQTFLRGGMFTLSLRFYTVDAKTCKYILVKKKSRQEKKLYYFF